MSIHARVEGNQLADLDPPPNLVIGLPRTKHLAAGDNAVLLAQQVVKRHIGFLPQSVKGKPMNRP